MAHREDRAAGMTVDRMFESEVSVWYGIGRNVLGYGKRYPSDLSPIVEGPGEVPRSFSSMLSGGREADEARGSVPISDRRVSRHQNL